MGNGEIIPFWEFNLRFKTDGSDHGPEPGKPVIVGTGMGGDRAAVVFSAPSEISASIAAKCPRGLRPNRCGGALGSEARVREVTRLGASGEG